MLSRSARIVSLLVLFLLVRAGKPSEVLAQTSSNPVVSLAPEGATWGPRALASTATWGVRTDAPAALAAPQSSPNMGRDVAMMGVGAAGVVIGSLVGGDGGMMIAITGGVIGLVGLYRYLR